MNTLRVDNLLLPQAALGFLWVIVLFIFCFLGIHLLKLAQMGWAQTKAPKEEEAQKPPPQKEKQTPKKGAPVYYIVEKRKKPPKSYGEPREITFK